MIFKVFDVKIIKHEFNRGNKERVVQLINKTNQFNLTSKRYNVSDIENMQNDTLSLVFLNILINLVLKELFLSAF